MLNLSYTLAFFLAVTNLMVLIIRFQKRISKYYVLMFCSVVVMNLGYMQLSDAATLDSAIIANQTKYLGTTFKEFFLIMSFSHLCKIKISRIVKIFYLSLCFFIFFCVSTVGSSDMYYSQVAVRKIYGITVMVKKHGPLYWLFPFHAVSVGIVGTVLTLQAMVQKKDVSYFSSFMLVMIDIVEGALYFLENLMGNGIPLVPFSGILMEFGVIILLHRISLHDVYSISSDYIKNAKAGGFLLFDSNERFLGADDTAKFWFPELAKIKIDMKIKDVDTDFLRIIMDWVRGYRMEKIAVIHRDDKIFKIKHSVLSERNHVTIHCFFMRDDTEQQQYTELVEKYSERLENDIDRKTEKIRQIQDDIIISMASIVENRDNNTGGHIARTSDVVKIFVNHLLAQKIYPQLTKESAYCITKAAPLHDFGKIAVPDIILNKPGKFTAEEYEIMKIHPEKGAGIVDRILQNSEDPVFKLIAVNVAHYHHEKWDGTGYPEKISGEDIPFEARIMALADVFDALVSKRVYKEEFSYDEAFRIIEDSSGSHFAPGLCVEFLKCRKQLEELYDSYGE